MRLDVNCWIYLLEMTSRQAEIQLRMHQSFGYFFWAWLREMQLDKRIAQLHNQMPLYASFEFWTAWH